MKQLRFILFLFGFLLLMSCRSFEMDREAFEKERNLWNTQNIKNYQFVLDGGSSSGPIGPIEITVNENQSQVNSNRTFYGRFLARNELKSICEIYDFINATFDYIDSIRNGNYHSGMISSMALHITYDTLYHYPSEVRFSIRTKKAVAPPGLGYYTIRIVDFIPYLMQNHLP